MNIFNSLKVLLYNYLLNKRLDTRIFLSNKIECIKCQKYNISDISNYETYNKKLISISPGGYKGIYMLGTCAYIKENYDISNYIFSGASAGAWNSLMMVCNKNIIEQKDNIINYSIDNSKNIFELEKLLKSRIMTYYKTEDFDLERLYIGVTTLDKMKINTKIYYNFEHLEDAIDCCIASSHIPLITGGMFHIYKNILSFDGGFSNHPYLHKIESIMHITPSIWKDMKNKNKKINYEEFTTLFSKDKYDFFELFKNGYEDAKANKEYLDSVFLK